MLSFTVFMGKMNLSTTSCYTSLTIDILRNDKPLLNGIFVEIGALDGNTHSNTKFLEEHFGWAGVLIEATPDMCNRLQSSGRNRAVKICGAICEEEFVKFSIHKGDELNGIVQNDFKDPYQKQITNYTTVKCQRFDKIFKKYRIRKIDIFSLDVEGAELLTLKTFNWSIPVHYWIVETKRARFKERSIQIENEFFNHNYKICKNNSQIHNFNTCFYLPNFDRIEYNGSEN